MTLWLARFAVVVVAGLLLGVLLPGSIDDRLVGGLIGVVAGASMLIWRRRDANAAPSDERDTGDL